jgi:hypothetical protein
MTLIIALIIFAPLAIVYFFLKRAIFKQTIIRFDAGSESYTEVYEDGKLVASFDN